MKSLSLRSENSRNITKKHLSTLKIVSTDMQHYDIVLIETKM